MADHAALARDYLAQAEAHPSDDPDTALLLASIGNGHALLSVSSQIRQLREALGDLKAAQPALAHRRNHPAISPQ